MRRSLGRVGTMSNFFLALRILGIGILVVIAVVVVAVIVVLADDAEKRRRRKGLPDA